MQTTKRAYKAGGAVVGAATLILGAATAVAAEPATADRTAPDSHATGTAETQVVQGNAAGAAVKAAAVQGTFSFTQSEVTPLEEVRRSMGDAARYLCGSELWADGAEAQADSLSWTIFVGGGASTSPFSATLGELADDSSTTVIMGCSCAGNPADGRASVNAEVTGVALCDLMQRAGVSTGANTVVFTSADGYEVALPLAYVSQRHSLVVFSVDGAPLADSMGGSNQLWLGSTSARYFARDIVSVSFETREAGDVPLAPGAAGVEEGANMPNVAVTGMDGLLPDAK